MKHLFVLLTVMIMVTSQANAQALTLSQKASLATSSNFQSRLKQALESKANYWNGQTSFTTLKGQKEYNYSYGFLRGYINGLDIQALTGYWLANYNTATPTLITGNDPNAGQPTDSEILNTNALDIVYDNLAGVVPGDVNLLVGSLTSSTSVNLTAIQAGSTVTLSVQASYNFTKGQTVTATSSSVPSDWFKGTILTYSGTSMVILVTDDNGTETKTDWTIN